jgi:hypothetical protein
MTMRPDARKDAETEGVPVPRPNLLDPSLSSMARAVGRSLAPTGPQGVLRPDPSLVRRPVAEPKFKLVPDGGGLRYDDRLYTARVARDGTVTFDNKKVIYYPEDGSLRPNDPEILRYEQARFLEATHEERMRLAARHRSERLRDVVAGLPAKLERIWADTARPAAERRKLLFQLWDESTEGATDPSAQRIDAPQGREARQAIAAFIRRRLPRGSADGYTDDELAELNRRRASRERFEPYLAMR